MLDALVADCNDCNINCKALLVLALVATEEVVGRVVTVGWVVTITLLLVFLAPVLDVTPATLLFVVPVNEP